MPAVCGSCEKSFTQQQSLFRHIRECHGTTAPRYQSNKMVCSACAGKFPNNSLFKKHVSDAHGVEVMEETVSFQSEARFGEWRTSVESNGSVKFVARSCKTVQGNRIVYYKCNRAGFYKTKVSAHDRKRQLKSQGSRKLDSHCPAQMTVTTFSTGTVNVNFTSTHFGHDFELVHLPISSPTKRQVAAKLANKIPFDTVLEDVRKMSGQMKRDLLLTKHDLRNISRQVKVLSTHESNESAETLEEMKAAAALKFRRVLRECSSKKEIGIAIDGVNALEAKIQALKLQPDSITFERKKKIDVRQKI